MSQTKNTNQQANNKILVIGANGTVGSHLVKLLQERGAEVLSATSRKEEATKPGRVYVNLVTGEGVHAAFSAADRAFLLSPPGFADHYSMLAPLIQASKRAGLKKVVLMTAMGANAVDSTPFRRAEIELENSGITYNIIRPNWFMQNFATFWVQGINESRRIALPAGEAATSFIDARDIAAVAAELLISDALANRDFDLTGIESLTHRDIAAVLSNTLGERVDYQNIEPTILRDGLVAAGFPGDYVGFLIMIFGFLREGYNARQTNAVQDITGQRPRTFKQFAAEHRTVWKH